MNGKARRILRTVLYHTIVLLLGMVMIYPVLWMISSSLKPNKDIFVDAHLLIPRQVVWANYTVGWKGIAGISFGVFFRNTFLLVVPATLAVVISSALAAYGFSRIRFTLRKLWFGCMIVTMLLPNQVLMIPQYILFARLGWTNTYLPMIVPAMCGQAFFIFLCIQFIQGIPLELDESATIDGCGRFQSFVRIMVPLIWPAMITCMIFSFYWRWDDFMSPLLYLRSVHRYPISMALRLFSDPGSVSDYGATFAMSTLSLFPVFIIFIVFQRYLVEGISTTGLKG